MSAPADPALTSWPVLSPGLWRGVVYAEQDTRRVQSLHPEVGDWPLDAVCQAWDFYSNRIHHLMWLDPAREPDFVLYLHAVQVCEGIMDGGDFHPEYDGVVATLLAAHGPLT